MGETLTIADQKEAYTLADRGTFLATDTLDSKLLLEGGEDLLWAPGWRYAASADGAGWPWS